MADNVLHPITGTGTADVTQRTFDLGSGVQAPAVVLVDETTGAAVGGTTAEGLKVNANHNGTAGTATWTSATAQNTAVQVATTGYSGVLLSFVGDGGGASTGVIVFEVSPDGGTTWFFVPALSLSFISADYFTSSWSVPSLSASSELAYCPVGGGTHFRIRLETTITGSESVALRLVPTTVPYVEGQAASLLQAVIVANTGSAAAVGLQMMGADGSTARRIKVDAAGELQADVLSLPSLVAGTANIGDVDVLTVPAPLSTTGAGTEASALRVTLATDSTGLISVDDNGASLTVDGTVTANAGTGPFPVSDNASSLTVDAPLATPVNVQIGNATLAAGVIDETGASAVDALAIGGGTAHDAADSGNPVKVGGVAVSGSATPTSVASGDRTRWIFNQHGIPYVMSGHPNLITREYDFGTAAQTDVNLAAAVVAADERIYVTRFEALCDNANTVAVSVRAGFGATAVPTASASGVSGMIASHPGIAAGSGIICGGSGGLIAVGGAGEEPRITTTAATTGNLHVVISYYLIDETP